MVFKAISPIAGNDMLMMLNIKSLRFLKKLDIKDFFLTDL